MKYLLFLVGFVAISMLSVTGVQAVRPSDVGLHEGDVVSASGSDDPDIYIVNEAGYKRLFLNPIIFGFYGHLGGFSKVRPISASVRDQFITSGIFRNCETQSEQVWAVEVTGEDSGVLHPVQMSGEQAVAQDSNFFSKVFCINSREEAWYTKSLVAYTALSQIPPYIRTQITPQPTVAASTGGPVVGGCQVFPSNNPWNLDISQYPVHARSANYIASIGSSGRLHPDFGGNGEYGIPYVVVPGSQPKVAITFTDYGDESDPGPYPIPANAPIEGGASSDGDRHVLVVENSSCKLYELFNSHYVGPGWNASSGAVWNLNSNALRPEGWTSADAAGLPVLPGLVRYDEVAAGAVKHALRFTVRNSQKAYIHPATHYASSSTDQNRPPMGLRLRLKASYDISGYTGQARVILEGLKKYGMIMADNGSNWYITGAADPRWNDDQLGQLKQVPGSAFEAVDTGPIIR